MSAASHTTRPMMTKIAPIPMARLSHVATNGKRRTR
jgi:hypothetical protein